MNSYFESKKKLWIFAGILILAFLLRVIGFNWGGEGTTFHPDEAKVYKDAIKMAEKMTYFSASNVYPAQFSQKILAVLYAIYFRIFKQATYVGCVFIARFVTALFGTLTCAVVYFLSEEIKEKSGLISCFLISCCGPLVIQSHCAVMDTEVGCATAIVLFLGIKYIRCSTKKQEHILVAIAGIVAGIATMEKYYGATLCFIIAGVVIAKNIKPFDLRSIVLQGILAFLCFGMTIFVIAPNLVIFYQNLLDGITHVTNDYDSEFTYWDSVVKIVSWYFSYIGIASLFFVVKAVWHFWQDKVKESWVLVYGLCFALYTATSKQGSHVRWLQPLFICTLVVAGIGIRIVLEKKETKKRIRGIETVLGLLCVVTVLSNGLLAMSMYGANYSDTTNVCERYLTDNDIHPENCIYDRYTCLRPAGISKYYDSIGVKDSFVEIEGKKYVNRLGRDYAVRWTDNPSDGAYVIKADYEVNKNTNDKYDKPSIKWVDPINIFEAASNGMGFWTGKKTAGLNFAIQDISNYKGIQYFEADDFDEAAGNLEIELSAINQGRYIVGSDNGDLPKTISIENSQGDCIFSDDLDLNQNEFTVESDYRNLIIKINGDVDSTMSFYIKEL